VHPLLQRQLRRQGLDDEAQALDVQCWPELLKRVSRAYEEHDRRAEGARAGLRARRQDESFAVCFVDLDRFKVINDTLGHDAGASGLSTVAQKTLAAIRESLMIHGCSFLVTGSIGIAPYPADGHDAATMLRHADAAMYLAKDRGKSNVQFHTAELADTAARQFELELTESVVMADPKRANEVLRQLNAMGMRNSIDDFGTGYSSLSCLKRFPAYTVKTDRSFISGLPSDADDTAITQAVIAMAHSLGLKVVAEGVETVEQLTLLRQMGCDVAQGHLLGRPMPASGLVSRLSADPASAARAA